MLTLHNVVKTNKLEGKMINKKVFLNFIKSYLIIGLLVIGVVNETFAAVVYINDNRRVDNISGRRDQFPTSVNTPFYPNAPFADMDVVGQTSSLTSNGFSANGKSINLTANDFVFKFSASYFDVSFNVDTESRFNLKGLLTSQTNTVVNTSAYASIYIYSGVDLLFENLLYGNSTHGSDDFKEAQLNFNALLSAGDYRILVGVETNGITFGSINESTYSLSADIVSTVPVPAAVWLFSSGLFLLIGVVKRVQ